MWASMHTFTFLLTPKTLLHMRWHSWTTPSFSIVPGFCTDLPSAASSSLSIHLWHVLCTHPSLSRSERRSSHRLWSWPSWRGEHWWLCTGHASAPGAEAAWKGRNLLVSASKTAKKHTQIIQFTSPTGPPTIQNKVLKAKTMEKIYWLCFMEKTKEWISIRNMLLQDLSPC